MRCGITSSTRTSGRRGGRGTEPGGPSLGGWGRDCVLPGLSHSNRAPTAEAMGHPKDGEGSTMKREQLPARNALGLQRDLGNGGELLAWEFSGGVVERGLDSVA